MSAEECACSSAPKLIFPCSGAADVGELADRTARKLTREGHGKMFCLAGIGGRLPPMMKAAASAGSILAIDGCATNCVKACLEQAGFTKFEHLRLYDHGFAKGKSPVTDEAVAQAAAAGAACLR